jgi:hypothetical protein
MREIRFADLNLGVCVLTFDGRAVELFTQNGASSRLHVLMLTIDVRGPDRKDRYVIDMAPVQRGHGAVRLVVSADVYALIGPTVAEIGTALQAAG